jgi:hypothetical protein
VKIPKAELYVIYTGERGNKTSVLHGPEWNGDVTIMMSLFDEEQIMKTYARDLQKQAAQEATKQAVKETARRMIAMGKMTLEEVGECVPDLTMDELRKIEAEVMELV